MTEIWKPIAEYDTYSVSIFGQVRNDETGRVLKSGLNSRGYFQARLHKNGGQKSLLVHRLIAIAFIPNPESKEMVDHIDGNPINNSLENLRWATACENQHNRKISSNNTSSVKGVYWHKQNQKWCARINVDGKQMHIGYFETIEDSSRARQSKASELFGAFTNLCEKSLPSR
jgi:hypothetical protein